VYLFIGNGQTLQYEDMEAVKTVLAATLDPILPKGGEWVAVYGGDTCDPENPDLGACMQWVKQRYKPHLLAVQAANRTQLALVGLYRIFQFTG